MKIERWNDNTEYVYHDEKDPVYVSLPERYMGKITDHIKNSLCDYELVFHESKSEHVHMDVIPLILPEKYSFNMLVTMGMSAKPMDIPNVKGVSKYAELVMCLPKNWEINSESLKDKKLSWPITTIKHLGVFPHDNNTFLSYGHTISNGNPTRPYAENTDLCYMFIDKPRLLPKSFLKLNMDDKKEISFLCLMPMYEEELKFKEIYGADALVEKFIENDISQVLDINRKNVCEGFI